MCVNLYHNLFFCRLRTCFDGSHWFFSLSFFFPTSFFLFFWFGKRVGSKLAKPQANGTLVLSLGCGFVNLDI